MGLVIQRKIQGTLRDCVSIYTCVLDIFTILLLLLFSAWIRVSPLSLLWLVSFKKCRDILESRGEEKEEEEEMA